MNTRSVIIGALAIIATACDPAAPSDTSEYREGDYLFGLTKDDLQTIYPLVREQYTEAEWLSFNAAPFDCNRYDELCLWVGEAAARDITHDALMRALDGETLLAIEIAMDEEIAAATEEWEHQEAATSFRDNSVGTSVYSCGNHRLRNETQKINPAIGSRYGKVICTHQTDLGSGIWGGSQDADMVAEVEIVESGEDASASQFTHRLESPKVYPGRDQTVRGVCTGEHDGERSVTRSVD